MFPKVFAFQDEFELNMENFDSNASDPLSHGVDGGGAPDHPEAGAGAYPHQSQQVHSLSLLFLIRLESWTQDSVLSYHDS